jgi:hypothetical protein
MTPNLIHRLTSHILNAPDRTAATGKGIRILAKMHARKDRQMTLTRANLELSDLFFNHQHPHFDAVCESAHNAKAVPSREDMDAAIREDAAEFCENYPAITDGWTADDFARDFMDRL